MSGSNYSIRYNGSCATLYARTKGTYIPLISSEDIQRVERFYQNILTGVYSNVLELCEDIHNNFSTQATLLVRVTLFSNLHSSAKA